MAVAAGEGAESGGSRHRPGSAGGVENQTTGASAEHALMTITERKKERKRKKRKHSSHQRLQTTDSRIPTNPKQDLTRKKKVPKIRKSRDKNEEGWRNLAQYRW